LVFGLLKKAPGERYAMVWAALDVLGPWHAQHAFPEIAELTRFYASFNRALMWSLA